MSADAANAPPPIPATAAARANLVGVGWMLLTGLCFVAVNGLVHWISVGLPAAQGAFIRFLFGLLFLSVPLVTALRTGFAPQVWGLLALRGGLHAVAVILWFYAMAHITVAEVTAIGFLNPIVVTAGAALFLGERLGWRRMVAIGVALGGALIVLRPGVRDIGAGHLAQLGAAFGFGASYLVAKRLAPLAPASVLVAVLSLVVAVVLAPVALAVWVPPTLAQVAALAATAVFATAGHYAMARAFAAAPLTVTQPVTFLQLLWASLLGVAVFGEPLDHWVLAGGAIMIAAISWITWRESRLRGRAPVTPPPVTDPPVTDPPVTDLPVTPPTETVSPAGSPAAPGRLPG